MKKLILTMAAVSAAAIAAPAAAQYQRGYADAGVEVRTDQLGARIDAGVRQGSISAREASSLRMQLGDLQRLEQRFSRGGFSAAERAELQQRTQNLRQQIRVAGGGMGGYGRDGDRWGERDGRYDRDARDCPPGLDRRDNGCIPPGQAGRDGRWEDRRDDRDGRWEDRRDDRDARWEDGREDRDRDGYDDRDLNRDGRIDAADQRTTGRDRGVVGQILDRVGGNGSALRVGQRASADLGAVPYDLRTRYRDDSRVYYRADRRNVYGIDARTNVVLQVYALNR
jgi:hypothetical protein